MKGCLLPVLPSHTSFNYVTGTIITKPLCFTEEEEKGFSSHVYAGFRKERSPRIGASFQMGWVMVHLSPPVRDGGMFLGYKPFIVCLFVLLCFVLFPLLIPTSTTTMVATRTFSRTTLVFYFSARTKKKKKRKTRRSCLWLNCRWGGFHQWQHKHSSQLEIYQNVCK